MRRRLDCAAEEEPSRKLLGPDAFKSGSQRCCSQCGQRAGNVGLLVSGRELIEAVRQRRKSGTNGRRAKAASRDNADTFIDAVMAAAVDWVASRLSNYRQNFEDAGPIPGLLDVLVSCQRCLERQSEIPQVRSSSVRTTHLKQLLMNNHACAKTNSSQPACCLPFYLYATGKHGLRLSLDGTSLTWAQRLHSMQILEGCIGASVQAEFHRMIQSLSARSGPVPKDADRIVEIARGCSEILDEEVAYFSPLFSSHIRRPAELAAIKVHECLNQHLLPWLQTGASMPTLQEFQFSILSGKLPAVTAALPLAASSSHFDAVKGT